jgi:hypothetical protein
VWHRDSGGVISEADISFPKEVHMHLPLLKTDHTYVVPGSHALVDVEQDAAMATLRSNNESGVMHGQVALEMNPGDGAIFHVKAIHRGSYPVGYTRRTIAISFCAADRADMPTADTLVERKGYDHVYQPWFGEPGYLHGCTSGSLVFWNRFCATYSAAWKREYCNGLGEELRGYFWPDAPAAPLPRL